MAVTAPTVPSQLLTVREASQLLRTSRATLYRMVQSEELSKVKLSSKMTRFRLDDVERLIASKGEKRS